MLGLPSRRFRRRWSFLGTSLLSGLQRRTKRARRARRFAATAPAVQVLEDRTLLSANLFIDYGVNFPDGTLTTTQGAFRDIADAEDDGDKILGPELEDSEGNFNEKRSPDDGTRLDIVDQDFSTAARAAMRAVVERAFSALDVNVIELTDTDQTTPDGRTVQGAASMADVIDTLRGGEPLWKDAYIFVAEFIVDPGGPNEETYTGVDVGGTSPGSAFLGVDSDREIASNEHDDVAVVFSDGGISRPTLNNIAHEAGHLFGLQHAITNPVPTEATNLFHRAEIMSYRNTGKTTSSTFTRYPMIRGDDNTPDEEEEKLEDYDDLAARKPPDTDEPVHTLYDQLMNDPNVGAKPDVTFVSGTGAHDIITITRNGASADVTVEAFGDADYSEPIRVPGETDTTYSYSIPLTHEILVHAGGSDDRIVVNGDLGVDVEIDGMLGTDELIMDGRDAANAVYTPNATVPDGVDLDNDPVPDYGGTITIEGNSILFNNFEKGSNLEIQEVSRFTFDAPGSGAELRISDRLSGDALIEGTSGGNDIIPVTVDTTVSAMAINGTTGDDMLTVDLNDGNPIPSGGIDYDGGLFSSDSLEIIGDGTTTGTYTPDDVFTGDGEVSLSAGTIDFENLTPVTVSNMASFTFLTPNSNDVLTVDSSAAGRNRITGTSGGVAFESLAFFDVDNFTVDMATNDGASPDDTITITDPGLVASSLDNFTVNAGNGDDSFTVNPGANFALDTIILNGGSGDDSFAIPTEDSDNFDALTANGGPGNDTFNVRPSVNSDITINGGPPEFDDSGVPPGDLMAVDLDGVGGANVPSNQTSGTITSSTHQPIVFNSIETVIAPDRFENNDNIARATVLGSVPAVVLRDLSIHNDEDRDFFQVTAHDTGKVIVNALFEHDIGDIDARIRDENGNVLKGAFSVTDDERIVFPAVAQERYFIEVFGVGSDINNYALEVEHFPAPVPNAIVLDPKSDTGRDNGDNLTRDETARILVESDLTDFAEMGIDILSAPEAETMQAGIGDTPGAAVQVFVDGQPVGFADPVPGTNNDLFEFTFAAGDLEEGRNLVKAATRMFDGQKDDPGEADDTPEVADPDPATARTQLSEPLQLTLDTTPPPVAFGSPDVEDDGLASDSDTGVAPNTHTFSDRITGDTTPTLWGTAEADAVVRVFADTDDDGRLDADDVLIGQTVAEPVDGNQAFADGRWEITSAVNLNDPELFDSADGERTLFVTAEDPAGNLNQPGDEIPSDPQQVLDIFLDTQGPQVTDVTISNAPAFDLFDVKPTEGPTPLVDSLTIDVRDLPPRTEQFIYDALKQDIAAQSGHYAVTGDRVGNVAITNVTVTQSATADEPSTATIRLDFAEPLPDDRFTLTISDFLVDPAGNPLDGESDAGEPNGDPSFPSGDGVPGGDFLARFTVDSRPEIGTWGQAGTFVDANGNFLFDPPVAGGVAHDVSRDLAFDFGIQTDHIFAGDFNGDGFDELGAYGKQDGAFRFLLDANGNGRVDAGESFRSNRQTRGRPVAGNFDGNPNNGEEIGLFDGRTWYLDTTGNDRLDTALSGNLRGWPVAGDFDGDGQADLAGHVAGENRFFFSLSSQGGSLAGGNADVTASFDFGFPGVLERPFAADFNQDGITDIGLITPNQNGNAAELEWYLVVSDPVSPEASPAENFAALTRPFSPTPLGNDIFTTLGDNLAKPVVGNFDPPLDSAREVPDLSGTWMDNGFADSARIEQSGNSLLFINRRDRESSGRFLSPTEIVATDWGNLHGTIEGDRILWDNGIVWDQSAPPDLSGIWDDNGFVASARIEQDGENSLRITNRRGRETAARFLSSTEIVATDWGNLHGTIEGDRILWDNGVVWAQSVDPESIPDLSGIWDDNGFVASARIEQDGENSLRITNRRGRETAARFLSSTEIVATDWNNLHGTIEGDRILWDNGVVWARFSPPENVPDLSGTWTDNGFADSARIEQSGSSLTFINRRGRQSAGWFVSPTEIVATDWNNLHGTLEGNRIRWDNGIVWEASAELADLDAVFADTDDPVVV